MPNGRCRMHLIRSLGRSKEIGGGNVSHSNWVSRTGAWSVVPLPVSPIDGLVATVGSRLLVSDTRSVGHG